MNVPVQLTIVSMEHMILQIKMDRTIARASLVTVETDGRNSCFLASKQMKSGKTSNKAWSLENLEVISELILVFTLSIKETISCLNGEQKPAKPSGHYVLSRNWQMVSFSWFGKV